MSETKINMERISIRELQSAMEKGEITSYEITCYYLNRIAKYDSVEGGLNSVLEVNPDALAIARKADLMRQKGEVKGALHGVPVLLKDNVNTNDKNHTSAGSLSLKDNYAAYDAHITELLREEGAVLLGKANMTEFANILTVGMRNGYSSRGGCVLCPHNKEADPLGSSTGSAVAVAADLCTVSIGTETFGSIMSPARSNGVVGIKPTMGMVSRTGIIPISHTFDTAGPFARSVGDAAVLLNAITDYDESDPITYGAKKIDVEKALSRSDIKGLRIGVHRNGEESLSPLNKKIMDEFFAEIIKNGAEIIEIEPQEMGVQLMDVVLPELKTDMNYYLSTTSDKVPYKTMEEIILFNQANHKEALKYGQQLFLRAQYEYSGGMTEASYIAALMKREEMIEKYKSIFEENMLDVLIPVVPNSIAAIMGFPSINLPLGYKEENTPIGSYWMGLPFEEEKLIGIVNMAEKIWNCKLVPQLD